MAVTDGVFDEGTFDSSTFGNVSRSESFTVNDSSQRVASQIRERSESLTVLDADTFDARRQFSESFGFNDAPSKDFRTSVSDSFTVSDTLTASSLFFLNESIGLNDNTSQFSALVRSDSFSLDDQFTRIGGAIGTVPQDGVFNTGRFGQSTVNTLRRGEEVNVETNRSFVISGKQFSEVLGVDAALRPLLAKTFNETVTVDQTRLNRLFDKNLDESLDLNIQRDFLKIVFRRQTETLNLLDETFSKFAVTDLVETIGLTDDAAVRFNKNNDESIGLSDFVDQTFRDFKRKPSESVVLNDTRAIFSTTDVSASFGLNDEPRFNLARAVDEAVGLTDETRSLFAPVLTEQVVVADTFRGNTGIFIGLIDSFGVSDAPVTKEAELFRTQTESVVVDDNALRVADLFRSLTDTVGLVDEEAATLFRGKSESFGLVDKEAGVFTSLVRDENIGLDDNFSLVGDFFRTFVEHPSIQDSDIKDVRRPLSETMGIGDNALRVADYFRTRSETVDLVDVSTTLFAVFRDETLNMQDTALREAQLFRTLDPETVNMVDDLSLFVKPAALKESFQVSHVPVNRFIGLNPAEVINIEDIRRVRQATDAIPSVANIEFVGSADKEVESK